MSSKADNGMRAWLLRKFDVSRYSEASQFDEEDWYSQLTYRFHGFKKPWQMVEEDTQALVNRILEAPLRDGHPEWLDCAVNKQLAVWDLGVWEVFRLSSDLKRVLPRRKPVDPEHDPNFVDFWPKPSKDNIDFEPECLRRKAMQFLEFGPGEPASAPIGVDLTLTDEQIVSEFRRWLKSRRKSWAPRSGWGASSFSEVDFNRWVSCQVLAYIDLTAVASRLEVRLTRAQIGELLFPSGGPDFDAESKVAKSVVPLVKQVFRPETFHALAGQASSRLRKAESESGTISD